MPIRTLDEYLKQTTLSKTSQQISQTSIVEKISYKVVGFYKETEFKETPIGKIPKEWKIVKLYEITEKVKAGGTPRVSRKEYWNGNIPFVKIEDLTASRKFLYSTKTFITELGLKNSNAWIVPEESLLLAMYGSMGEVAINKIKVATNQAILGIIPKPNSTTVEYLYYWFLFFKPRWRIYAKWTTQPNLTAEIVKNSYVPLPPLEEQWGIAEVLSCVDKAIDATERLIEKLERLKKALMQELLTKGIGHKEYKQTPIGKIPKEWQVVKLHNVIIKSIGGGTPSTKNPRYWDGDIPWMTSVGIPEDDIYITKGERFITEEGLRNSTTNIIPKGNLIVATRVGLGKAGVNLIDIAINQDLVGLILDKKQIMPEFLAYYLRSPKARTYIMAAARGTTIKGISRQALFNIRIPLPTLNEQQKIVNMLITFDRWIKLEKKQKEKSERLKKGLMNLLLTGRVRVRVAKQEVSIGSSR